MISGCFYLIYILNMRENCSEASFECFRVSQVTCEGKYKQSDVPRQLVYGTMVYVRQTIVADASCALSRAVCIATRYSAVRRQFGSQNGGPETQVVDKSLHITAVKESNFSLCGVMPLQSWNS